MEPPVAKPPPAAPPAVTALPVVSVGDRVFQPEVAAAMARLDANIGDLTRDYLRQMQQLEDTQARVTLAAKAGVAPSPAGPPATLAPVRASIPAVSIQTIENIDANPIPETWKASRLIGGRAAPDSETIKVVAENYQRISGQELNALAVGALEDELKRLRERATAARALKVAFEKDIKERQDAIRERMGRFLQALRTLASFQRSNPAGSLAQQLVTDVEGAWSGSNSGQTFDDAMYRVAETLNRAIDFFNRGAVAAGAGGGGAGEEASRQLQAALARITTLTAEQEAAAATVAAVRNQLVAAEAEIATLRAQVTRLDDEKRELERQIEQLRKELAECRERGGTQDKEVDLLRARVAGLAANNEAGSRELEARRTEIDRLGGELTNRDNTARKLNEDLTSTRQGLDTSRKDVARLEAEVNQLKADLRKSAEGGADEPGGGKKARPQLSDEQVAALEAPLRARIQALERETQLNAAELGVRTGERDAARQLANDVTGQLNALRDSHTKQADTIVELNKQLVALKESSAKLGQDLAKRTEEQLKDQEDLRTTINALSAARISAADELAKSRTEALRFTRRYELLRLALELNSKASDPKAPQILRQRIDEIQRVPGQTQLALELNYFVDRNDAATNLDERRTNARAALDASLTDTPTRITPVAQPPPPLPPSPSPAPPKSGPIPPPPPSDPTVQGRKGQKRGSGSDSEPKPPPSAPVTNPDELEDRPDPTVAKIPKAGDGKGGSSAQLLPETTKSSREEEAVDEEPAVTDTAEGKDDSGDG